MAIEPFSSLDLPFDLGSLLSFTLVDSFPQSLATSSCNNFFEPYRAEDGTGRIRIRREGEAKCWGLLPVEWREHFEAIQDRDAREEVLKQLSLGLSPQSTRNPFPSSLQSFLDSCRALSFDRTCSLDPILTYPPTALSESPPAQDSIHPLPSASAILIPSQLKGKAKAHHTNALKAGQSPKKQHEVVKFCELVRSMMQEERCSYCVDVGSGRAHLSRALASPPLDLHVLALDWSSSQKSGAEKIDDIRTKAELHPTIGSLTHRVSSLDEAGVKRVLQEWPPVTTEASIGAKREPALLVALHACGDLTPDSIKAFTDFSSAAGNDLGSLPRAVFVGCCYNLQTPSLFPLSGSIASGLASLSHPVPNPIEPISLAHLRLTPQSPPTWHLTRASTTAFLSATSKLAYRSRLEAELEWNGFGTAVGERKVGRIPDRNDWNGYREEAIKRIKVREGEQVKLPEPCRYGEASDAGDEDEDEDEDWHRGLFLLRVWWTIRSWLGPPLESLVVLDRYLLLVEGLYRVGSAEEGARRRVEMVNIFDQATGSLRNIALVVR